MLGSRLFVAAILMSDLAAVSCSERHENTANAAVGEGGTVSMPLFDSVELRGGGHVILRYGAAQHVTLARGSAEVTRFSIEDGHKLVIDLCEDRCPADYDLEVDIVTPRLAVVAVDGGGKIVSEAGFPAQDQIAAAVQGGGVVDFDAIDVGDVQAAVSGGGDIRVHADRHLTAAVNGGGSIRYSGNAQLETAVNGGGTIQPEGGD